MFLELDNIIEKETSSIIIFPINDLVRLIEINLSRFLLPPPSGIYSNYLLEPILLDRDECLLTTNHKDFELANLPINNLLINDNFQRKTYIYNKHYKYLFCSDDFKINTININSYYPYRCIKISIIIIENLINQLVSYNRKNLLGFDNLISHLSVDEIVIKDIFDKLNDDAINIVGKYLRIVETEHNKIYKLKFTNNPFIVNMVKSLDWRAYEFEKQRLLSTINSNTNFPI